MEKTYVNHKFHIILSVITLGYWLPIYGGLYLYRRKSGAPTLDLSKKKELKAAAKEQRRQEIIAKMASKPGAATIRQRPKQGYKKGKGFLNSTPYVLECNHMIRAKVGMKSRSHLRGETVYCDVCKAQRVVVGTPRLIP
jgi:hypothetical protein